MAASYLGKLLSITCTTVVFLTWTQTKRTTSRSHFKAIIAFWEKERTELVGTGTNSTTSAFERTGIAPFNPYSSSWEDAIATLGAIDNQRENHNISYEVVLKSQLPNISDDEKEALRKDHQDPNFSDLLESDIAILLGEAILGLWRRKIEEGVREGNNYNDIAKITKPTSVVPADNSTLQAKLKFVEFKLNDTPALAESCVPITLEEKMKRNDENIIKNTKVTEPVRITWHLPDNDNNDWLEGTATKMDPVKWTVILPAREMFQVGSDELLEKSKCKIQHAYQNKCPREIKFHKQRRKRQRAAAQREIELKIREEAIEKHHQAKDLLEEKEMLKKMSNGEQWNTSEFLAMVSRLWEPFQSTIDDCKVKVCGKNVAIMMEQTCMKYIAEKVLVKTDKRTREEGGNGNTTNKKQKKNSCDTTYGSNMIGAYQGSVHRDAAQQQKANEKEKSTLQRELTNIEAALKLASERKAKYGREILLNIPNFTPTPYWSVSAQSSASDMVMFLRLFDPTCGKISKKRQSNLIT